MSAINRGLTVTMSSAFLHGIITYWFAPEKGLLFKRMVYYIAEASSLNRYED